MNRKFFSGNLAARLKNFKAEFQPFEEGNAFVKIVQSDTGSVKNWPEKCENTAKKFFDQFRVERFKISTGAENAVSKKVEGMIDSIRSDQIDCWFILEKEEIVIVGLKKNVDSVIKLVENIIRMTTEEHEKPKQVVRYADVPSSDHADFLEKQQFLRTIKENNPGLVEVNFADDKSRTKVCFVGSNEATSDGIERFHDFMKNVEVRELGLSKEVVCFMSKKSGVEYLDTLFSKEDVAYHILVTSKDTVKIITRSAEEYKVVRDLLCKSIYMESIDFPALHEHILSSKQWCDLLKSIEEEKPIDYKVERVDKAQIHLYGAKHVVNEYSRKIRRLISSLTLESKKKSLLPGVARFIKEKMTTEIDTIQTHFKDEHLKIEIVGNECDLVGTKEGVLEGYLKIRKLENKILSESKDMSRVRLSTLMFGENGKRNVKGIEDETNVVIEVIELADSARDEGIKNENMTSMTASAVSNPVDPFDVCKFITNEGLNVSWKYGNIAEERVCKNLRVDLAM